VSDSESNLAATLNQFRPMLLTLAEAMISPTLRRDLEASDLVQQTLLEAHCNMEQLVRMNAAVIFSWLRSALQHNMQDAIRHLHAQKHDIRRRVQLSDLENSWCRLQELFVDQDTSPSEVLQRNEQLCLMLSALQTLPENQRAALILKHLKGHSLKEVAEALQLSESAAAGLLHRGRQRLAQCLEDHSHG
jgi:RNA polymerase sigma-70 factor (ECF subfamily)